MKKEKNIMAVRKSAKKKEQPLTESQDKKAIKTKTSQRNVKFALSSPAAGEVLLAGEFNNWDNWSIPLKKSNDGIWSINIRLLPGRYEYNFIVDGNWVQDTSSPEMVTNPFGTQNSVIIIE